ncbi:MAG TPA: hypothetical protein VKN18_24950 [Blastocatellia bacterium]|nr:hypothetical protein [Blastocatellia bacterium]
MTFGTTISKLWVEAIPTERGPSFTGRTFSRLHMFGNASGVTFGGEIWATSDPAVESHAHESDEMLYVLSGAIEINGLRKRMKWFSSHEAARTEPVCYLIRGVTS